MSNERPWNAQDKAKYRELYSIPVDALAQRCFEAELKLDDEQKWAADWKAMAEYNDMELAKVREIARGLQSKLDAATKLKDKLILDTGKGCSVCGHTPVVNLPDGSGTYWLCGDCVQERLNERDDYRNHFEACEKQRLEQLSRLHSAELLLSETTEYLPIGGSEQIRAKVDRYFRPAVVERHEHNWMIYSSASLNGLMIRTTYKCECGQFKTEPE